MLKYTTNTQSGTRNMDLTIESWLNIYTKGQLVQDSFKSKSSPYFTEEQLEIFLQMIVNEIISTPIFLVYEGNDFYAAPSSKLIQLLCCINILKNDETTDPRMIRRILSHKLNIVLVQADSKLDPQDLSNMEQFYL